MHRNGYRIHTCRVSIGPTGSLVLTVARRLRRHAWLRSLEPLMPTAANPQEPFSRPNHANDLFSTELYSCMLCLRCCGETYCLYSQPSSNLNNKSKSHVLVNSSVQQRVRASSLHSSYIGETYCLYAIPHNIGSGAVTTAAAQAINNLLPANATVCANASIGWCVVLPLLPLVRPCQSAA